MSSTTNTIKGDHVVFRNSYGSKAITLKHDSEGYSLKFDSKCIFRQGIDFAEVVIGDYTITVGDNGDLSFSKDGQQLMSLNTE